MENVPDILKKSDYEQNIEPNFVILIDKYKHRLQIRIKWIIAKFCRFFEFHQKILCQLKTKQRSTPCA